MLEMDGDTENQKDERRVSSTRARNWENIFWFSLFVFVIFRSIVIFLFAPLSLSSFSAPLLIASPICSFVFGFPVFNTVLRLPLFLVDFTTNKLNDGC